MENFGLNKFISDFDIALLSEKTPADAARVKFEKGRAEHGEIFLKDPFLELYQELIDGMNYCDTASKRGGRSELAVKKIKTELEGLANRVKLMMHEEGFFDHECNHYDWQEFIKK